MRHFLLTFANGVPPFETTSDAPFQPDSPIALVLDLPGVKRVTVELEMFTMQVTNLED